MPGTSTAISAGMKKGFAFTLKTSRIADVACREHSAVLRTHGEGTAKSRLLTAYLIAATSCSVTGGALFPQAERI
jgi:hypothetical protein